MKKLTFILLICTLFVSCRKKNLVYPSSSIENGLVAYYPFDGNFNDLTPFRNHGVSSATFTSDRNQLPNKSLNFVANEFQSSNIPINLKSNYTFSFWIKMNSYDDGMAVMELTKDKSCSLNPQIWQWKDTIFLSTASNVDGRMPIMSLQRVKFGFEPPTWNHVLWTVKNDTTKLYVNGNMINSKIVEWPDLTNVDLTLGNAGNHCTGDLGQSNYHNQPSKVSIDEVRIYNRVLTQVEIAKLSIF
jgi:hypothetical protein